MIRASALSIRARNLMLVDYSRETAYVCSIRAGDLHLELVARGGTSGTWRLLNSGRDGERDMSTADQLAASLSAVLRVAAAENAGTVTVRLVDCPSSVIVIPQHEWPCFQLDGKPDEFLDPDQLAEIRPRDSVRELSEAHHQQVCPEDLRRLGPCPQSDEANALATPDQPPKDRTLGRS